MKKLVPALAVVGVLVLAWLLWFGTTTEVAAPPTPSGTAPAARMEPAVRLPAVTADADGGEAEPAPGIPQQPPRKCWEIEDVAEQGLPERELELLYSLAPLGPDFETFRYLDPASVESIAAQGDSAAMTLVGLMQMGEAFGANPEDVFSLVVGDEGSDELLDSLRMPEAGDEITARFEQAGAWFYAAALHGRIGALAFKGLVDEEMKRTAVDMGWISADAYEELEAVERSALQPAMMYLRAITQLAPGVAPETFQVGPTTGIDSDAVVNATHDVIRQYHEDLASRGLPRPAILDADLPAFREAVDTMCR